MWNYKILVGEKKAGGKRALLNLEEIEVLSKSEMARKVRYIYIDFEKPVILDYCVEDSTKVKRAKNKRRKLPWKNVYATKRRNYA